MMAQLVVCCLFAAPEAAASQEALVGRVRVVGPATFREVLLRIEGTDEKPGETLTLAGDLVDEVARLQSALVEVTGKREGKRFVVRYYYIMDVGGGVEPAVGTLVSLSGGGLGLSDGVGQPIPLSIRPRSKKRLADKIGSKLWIHGKELVSGELKVLRYGILKPAERAAKDSAKKSTPAEAESGEPTPPDTQSGDGAPADVAGAEDKNQ